MITDVFGIFDVLILFFLIAGACSGFKRGVIKSATMFIGAIVVIFLSFALKNPLSKLLYTYLPFFQFGGDFSGLTVLNIVIYEAIAFLVVYLVLMTILQIIIKVTGGIEAILKFTIILGIPSKLLGALFGAIESLIFIFIALFLLNQIPVTSEYVHNSFLGDKILTSIPVLSDVTKEYYQAFEEIISIKDQNLHDKETYNRECLNILLKYDIVTVDSVESLLESGKLEIENANDVLDQYRVFGKENE